LGVIGPTASGKSSLARMLVGVWRPLRGTVRLDGATLDQWSSEALGRHIGYVPQDVELFNGTVAQNICRFEDPPDRCRNRGGPGGRRPRPHHQPVRRL
jgi:ATP-binding cassette subfamily C protein